VVKIEAKFRTFFPPYVKIRVKITGEMGSCFSIFEYVVSMTEPLDGKPLAERRSGKKF